jgi:hypothetical protein
MCRQMSEWTCWGCLTRFLLTFLLYGAIIRVGIGFVAIRVTQLSQNSIKFVGNAIERLLRMRDIDEQ